MKNGWKACSWKEHNEYIVYSSQNASHFMQLKANLTKPVKLIIPHRNIHLLINGKQTANLFQVNDDKLM